MIVKMTEVWYKKVLERQPDGATILDVGIGTAGKFFRLNFNGCVLFCFVLH